MVQQKARAVPPSTFIDSSLQEFNEAQLRDVIRTAQRLLKAKAQEVRAVASSDGGLSSIQYPSGKNKAEANVDWSVFKLLAGAARDPWEVDWDVFELLTPARASKAKQVEEVNWDVFRMLSPSHRCAEPEEEPDVGDFSAIDWSGSRLPRQGSFVPPQRRPGCPGRVRSGQYHRAVEPRRRKGSGEAAIPTTPPQQPRAPGAPSMKHRVLQQRRPSFGQRFGMRIQQPCGGGRWS